MNKMISKASIFALLIGVSVYGWAGPCMPIAKACMKNGYHKGGEREHKGLVKDCVLPVVMGSKTLPHTNFSENQLQECKSKIAQKVKSKI
jgi:hypothetical protein